MSNSEAATENREVIIYDIMACNVYWDFENTPLNKEQHKFVISLHPTPGIETPELIESIRVTGPDGYEASISNQKQNNVNRDGWIYDPSLNYYWYMMNTNNGFMKAGEYTVTITCKDGSVVTRSRIQDDSASQAVLDAYINNRDTIFNSFTPSEQNPLSPESPLKDIVANWKTTKDVAGVDTFNVLRIGEASTSLEFDTQNLAWWDNIFMQRVYNNDPLAGQNRNEVTIAAELKPATSYGYFIETIDSNVQGETNICILQPHHFFTTP